jgi:urease accessory protein
MTNELNGASTPMALVRLLQLASPSLPIGGYSYSQGLEWAVERRIVCDAESAQQWIGDVMHVVMQNGEAPIAWRLLCAAGEDWNRFVYWNAWHRASRETAELRAETEQMGHSLAKLAGDLGMLDQGARDTLPLLHPVVLPAAFALLARGFGLTPQTALMGYVWSWLENQVLAAVKLVPLGQVAGQRLLCALGAGLTEVLEVAMHLADEAISTLAPGFALASARHETQYTRLFRS